MRRLGSGRPFLVLDAVAHALDFPAAAARLAGEASESADAFTAGATARIADRPAGPDFEGLGYAPRPWNVADSRAIDSFAGFERQREAETRFVPAVGGP